MRIFEFNVKQGQAIVKLGSDDLELLMHVKNYLELGDNDILEREKNVWTLVSFKNSDEYKVLMPIFQDAEEIELEYKDCGKVVVLEGKRYIYNCRTESIMIIDVLKKNVGIYNWDGKGLFVDTYKALRQLIAYQYLEMGALPIHSSAIALGGQGIIFVGDKKAGKTTLSVKSAKKYGRLCEYLGNDRMFVYNHNKKYYIYSLPTVIGMGLGMVSDDKELLGKLKKNIHQKAGGTATLLLDQPNIEESLLLMQNISRLNEEEKWDYIKEKIWLTPAELSVVTGCKCGRIAELKYIIIARIGNDNVRIQKNACDAKKVLSRNVLNVSKLYPNWMGLPNISDFETKTVIDSMCEDINIIEVSGNPEDIINALDEMYRKS